MTSSSSNVCNDSILWDSTLGSLGGHFLQSWRWGQFKTRHGWDVERVKVGRNQIAMAQVLFRKRGPVTVGYIPRGPAFTPGAAEPLQELFKQIDVVCKRRRALYLIVEADRSLPFTGTFKGNGFVRGP